MGIIGSACIAISANDSTNRHVRVEVHKEDNSNATVDIKADGDVAVFELPSMEEGETREIVSESGETIILEKGSNGTTVTLESGKEISLPNVHADIQAHISKGGMPLHTVKHDGIQVIGDLTESQQQIVNDALKAAGIEKNVNFVQGHDMKFISINGEHGGEFDVEFSSDSKINTWTSKDGEDIKIIKMGDHDGDVKVMKKVLVLKEEKKD